MTAVPATRQTPPPDGPGKTVNIPAMPLVLVGLMGSGKSTVGRKLAARLTLPFTDTDRAIEHAAGCSIPEIFERFGEEEFRRIETRITLNLLMGPPQVLATGGGAFMNEMIRQAVKRHGISLWLKADLETLLTRVERRPDRPLLRGRDPRVVLENLMAIRDPVYARADIMVTTGQQPIEDMVEKIIHALARDAQLHSCDGFSVRLKTG